METPQGTQSHVSRVGLAMSDQELAPLDVDLAFDQPGIFCHWYKYASACAVHRVRTRFLMHDYLKVAAHAGQHRPRDEWRGSECGIQGHFDLAPVPSFRSL